MDKNYICPVCGYSKLWFKPYTDYSKPATGYLEYCPSCGFQFGVSDLAKGDWTWRNWRRKWIKKDMEWDNPEYETPKDWDPKEQLKNIGIDIDQTGWENLEPQFSNEGHFLEVKKEPELL